MPGQVAADRPGTARIALVADLLVQDDRVRAAGVSPFPQVELIGVEGAGPAAGPVPDRELAAAGGADEPADSVARDPELGGDLGERAARGPEPVHVGVPAAGPDGDPVTLEITRVLFLTWNFAVFRELRRRGTAAARCSRWRATARSTASPRLCHRCHWSATRIASGAPRALPSNGTVRYWNCPNAGLGTVPRLPCAWLAACSRSLG